MKSVSILGCGWLGKPLAISLLDDGYIVKGSTTSEEKLVILKASEIDPYLIDISEFEEHDFFLASDILVVAITSKDINAFENLIQQIENSRVKKIIFISSTSVYPNINAVVTEDTKTKQTALSEIEELFRKNNFFETTILRFSGLLGPNRHPGNWFSEGHKIKQPKGFVNMIHLEDCIEIIHGVIDQNCWNITLNACSNHHPTRKDFYSIAKLSKNLKLPEFEENEDLIYKIVSSKKIQDTLDYTFIHDDLLSLEI